MPFKNTAEAEEAVNNLTSELTQLKSVVEGQRAGSDALRGQVSALTSERDSLKTSLNAATVRLETFDAEVERAAGLKALEIVAAQGVKPISNPPSKSAPTADELNSQLKQISDPDEKRRFYLAHRSVIGLFN